MNSSDFRQCWAIPQDISQQPYPSQTYRGALNMILLLAPVSPVLSDIYFRESKEGGCALIRFPGGGSMTQRRAGTCFYFIVFVFPPVCSWLLGTLFPVPDPVKVCSIALIEAEKWHRFGLKWWEHCENWKMLYTARILGDSSDTNEEKEEEPQSLVE